MLRTIFLKLFFIILVSALIANSILGVYIYYKSGWFIGGDEGLYDYENIIIKSQYLIPNILNVVGQVIPASIGILLLDFNKKFKLGIFEVICIFIFSIGILSSIINIIVYDPIHHTNFVNVNGEQLINAIIKSSNEILRFSSIYLCIFLGLELKNKVDKNEKSV